jgi:hypothetical protein
VESSTKVLYVVERQSRNWLQEEHIDIGIEPDAVKQRSRFDLCCVVPQPARWELSARSSASTTTMSSVQRSSVTERHAVPLDRNRWFYATEVAHAATAHEIFASALASEFGDCVKGLVAAIVALVPLPLPDFLDRMLPRPTNAAARRARAMAAPIVECPFPAVRALLAN